MIHFRAKTFLKMKNMQSYIVNNLVSPENTFKMTIRDMYATTIQ